VGGQRHTPAGLPPGTTRYPLYGSLGGSQGRSGQVRKYRPYWDTISGPSTRIPKVSKIYNFLQSGITTLGAIKPVRGNNINNCFSLLHNLPVRLWGQPLTILFSGDQEILSLGEAGREASDSTQSSARIKNQRELYLCASCMFS
jgi:hypothetical protein